MSDNGMEGSSRNTRAASAVSPPSPVGAMVSSQRRDGPLPSSATAAGAGGTGGRQRQAGTRKTAPTAASHSQGGCQSAG